MSRIRLATILAAFFVLGGTALLVYSNRSVASHQEAKPKMYSHDDDPWNQGSPPDDWWAAIERMHGHVGPWNVLGWRIGQAALRELETEWGRHELDIVCYVPMQTPYTCMADGLVMGTGNCLGRLDIRLAEVPSIELIRVTAHHKDGDSPVLVFTPKHDYLSLIRKPKADELEQLSQDCRRMKEDKLFRIERIHPSNTLGAGSGR